MTRWVLFEQAPLMSLDRAMDGAATSSPGTPVASIAARLNRNLVVGTSSGARKARSNRTRRHDAS